MNLSTLKTLEVDPDLCSECSFCRWVCPYDAVTLEAGKKEGAKIDLEKCRTCGLCYSTCPSGAIRTVYYPEELLLSHVKKAAKAGTRTVVLTCRGSAPPDLKSAVRESGVRGRYVEIKLPCLGRLDAGTVGKMLSQGVKELVLMPCEEDFCRFEKGSRALKGRFLLLKRVLSETGRKEVLKLTEKTRKVVFHSEKCLWCGT
ncbi:MAG: 4Fe-4S binding protein, partial [Candidatus Hadarchaeales archaeon]